MFLFGAMALSLFNVSHNIAGSGDCPFKTHQETVCNMNTGDHLSAWKSAFAATVPFLALLLLKTVGFAAALIGIPYGMIYARYRLCLLSRDVRERIYSFSYRPYQELFARGILHPKLF